MKVIYYPKCGTCKKAIKYLNEKGYEYELIDIKENPPTLEDIKTYHELSGLPIKRFFNTSGQVYRSLQLKDKLPSMTLEEQYQLLSSDGMLVKRPILIQGDTVLVGFKQKEWENL